MRRILPRNSILRVAICIVGITEAINQHGRVRENAKGRRHDPSISRFDEICSIVRNVFLLVLAPAVCSFLYSLYKDPATPLLARAIGQSIKKKLF